MQSAKKVIQINIELKPLIPKYVANCKVAIEKLEAALSRSDLEAIKSITHIIKGNAGSYGFHELGQMAISIEKLVGTKNNVEIKKIIQEMRTYMADSTIEFQ